MDTNGRDIKPMRATPVAEITNAKLQTPKNTRDLKVKSRISVPRSCFGS
jgi:hypothetical protein